MAIPTKTIKKNKNLEPGTGRKRKLKNFQLAMGLRANWADMDSGVLYHIQEYCDALEDKTIPDDKKPEKIRMTDLKTGKELGWAVPEIIEEKMKDPEPDPRY